MTPSPVEDQGCRVADKSRKNSECVSMIRYYSFEKATPVLMLWRTGQIRGVCRRPESREEMRAELAPSPGVCVSNRSLMSWIPLSSSFGLAMTRSRARLIKPGLAPDDAPHSLRKVGPDSSTSVYLDLPLATALPLISRVGTSRFLSCCSLGFSWEASSSSSSSERSSSAVLSRRKR